MLESFHLLVSPQNPQEPTIYGPGSSVIDFTIKERDYRYVLSEASGRSLTVKGTMACIAIFIVLLIYRAAERGQGKLPRALRSKGRHNTQCFKVWGPHKLSHQKFSIAKF